MRLCFMIRNSTLPLRVTNQAKGTESTALLSWRYSLSATEAVTVPGEGAVGGDGAAGVGVGSSKGVILGDWKMGVLDTVGRNQSSSRCSR